MSLSSIKNWISRRLKNFPSRAENKKRCESWGNNVRHYLTVKTAFRKVPRPAGMGRLDDADSGAGELWILDLDTPEARALVAEMRGVTIPDVRREAYVPF